MGWRQTTGAFAALVLSVSITALPTWKEDRVDLTTTSLSSADESTSAAGAASKYDIVSVTQDETATADQAAASSTAAGASVATAVEKMDDEAQATSKDRYDEGVEPNAASTKDQAATSTSVAIEKIDNEAQAQNSTFEELLRHPLFSTIPASTPASAAWTKTEYSCAGPGVKFNRCITEESRGGVSTEIACVELGQRVGAMGVETATVRDSRYCVVYLETAVRCKDASLPGLFREELDAAGSTGAGITPSRDTLATDVCHYDPSYEVKNEGVTLGVESTLNALAWVPETSDGHKVVYDGGVSETLASLAKVIQGDGQVEGRRRSLSEVEAALSAKTAMLAGREYAFADTQALAVIMVARERVDADERISNGLVSDQLDIDNMAGQPITIESELNAGAKEVPIDGELVVEGLDRRQLNRLTNDNQYADDAWRRTTTLQLSDRDYLDKFTSFSIANAAVELNGNEFLWCFDPSIKEGDAREQAFLKAVEMAQTDINRAGHCITFTRASKCVANHKPGMMVKVVDPNGVPLKEGNLDKSGPQQYKARCLASTNWKHGFSWQQGFLAIVLGDDCKDEVGLGSMVHEMGHLLGMGHEQERTDKPHYLANSRHPTKPGYSLQIEYSYTSLMHYSDYRATVLKPEKCGKNCKDLTREQCTPKMCGIGRREPPNFWGADVEQVRNLYKCKTDCANPPKVLGLRGCGQARWGGGTGAWAQSYCTNTDSRKVFGWWEECCDWKPNEVDKCVDKHDWMECADPPKVGGLTGCAMAKYGKGTGAWAQGYCTNTEARGRFTWWKKCCDWKASSPVKCVDKPRVYPS